MQDGAHKSTHTGPIIFSDPTARDQLVDEGEVVTFRQTTRTVGDTWWRETRTGPKRGDVTVELVRPADPALHDLFRYAPKSGFDCVADWIDAIERLNGSLDRGYLYRVTEGHSDSGGER